jgi:hypothetical protein
MAAGSTYTPIATTTTSGSQTTVSFTSISSAYTDLVLIVNAPTLPAGSDIALRFNSDSGTNYSRTWMGGNGTTATSSRQTAKTYAYLTYVVNPTGSSYPNAIAHIMNYSNTTTYKTVLSRTNDASVGTEATVNLWRSTSAITQIDVVTSGFTNGSTVTLYGIAHLHRPCSCYVS